MTEVLHQGRKFEIEPATLEDAIGIGQAHLRAWLEAYPNKEYGVTEEWIKAEFSFLIEDGQRADGSDKGIPFRRKVIAALDPNTTLYEVVKDENGIVQGFLHVDKTHDGANLNAIYLTDALKGTGVAHKLMEQTLAFTGNLPVQLQVVAYNERAVRFYEKYGFIRGDLEKDFFHGKVPILNMKLEARNEV